MGCLECQRAWVIIGTAPDVSCPYCGSHDVVRLDRENGKRARL